MYKGFPVSKATGYFAREFDKAAPVPGVNWSDEDYLWLTGAAQKGWTVKTSPQDVKPGALIVGVDQARNALIAIVREVKDGKITYEKLDKAGKVIRCITAPESLQREINFSGYIWPERIKNERARILLPVLP